VYQLVPGQRYDVKVYHGVGMSAGMAFENLLVGPGEVRDLGDIRTERPIDMHANGLRQVGRSKFRPAVHRTGSTVPQLSGYKSNRVRWLGKVGSGFRAFCWLRA
jgi:hypothetical protein